MGTYTELVLKCTIKDDCPEIVQETLSYLFALSECPQTLPDHNFFKKERWKSLGSTSSYYHCPQHLSFYDGKYLFSRSDLKNYDNEIDSFLDWLMPYISSPPGKFIGWIFTEQSKEPIFIYNEGRWGDEPQLESWVKFAKDSMISCCSFYVEEGHKKHEYEYCERSIMHTIEFLNNKREHEKN